MPDILSTLTQTILQCDEPSSYTGRVYPREEVEKAIAKYQETIDQDIAYGTVGSSDDGTMNISCISHKVTDLSINEAGEVRAEIAIVDTPTGNALLGLLEENAVRLSPCMSGFPDELNMCSRLTLLHTAFIPKSS